MSEKCFTRNPLVRDGTSQEQRLLKTLLPAYVAVDERSMKDLAEFAAKFATEIQYYQNDDTRSGDWADFFELTNDWEQFSIEEFLDQLKVDQQTKPHLALFFGFLYMFKVAQDDVNTITQRHLDFYYREVLQLEEQPAVPDQVAMIFKLAKHVDTHLIKKGTILKAGKDDTGVELFYKVDEDVAINKAQVTELKAVYGDISNNHQLYASPVANSSDGNGAKIENEEQSWKTFGKPTSENGRDLATVGFAFASPVLHLREGERKLTLSLRTNLDISKKDLQHTSFEVYFSGEKEWIKADSCSISNGKEDLAKTDEKFHPLDLIIRATLIPDQDPVVAYDQVALTDPFDTTYPVVKIVFNQETPDPIIYQKLKKVSIAHAKLKVAVTGVRSLILQNDQAVLDANKPFEPFGNRPHKGSNFYIGNWEVFQKQLTSLDLKVAWNELPESSIGFQGYYTNYIDGATGANRSNRDFKISAAILDKKDWKPINFSTKKRELLIRPLFTNKDGVSVSDGVKLPDVDSEPSLIRIPNPSLDDTIEEDENLEPITALNNDVRKGFLRLTLRNQDFGHGVFAKSFSKQSILLATWDGEGTAPALPNEPYTPTIKELSIDYQSEAVIILEQSLAKLKTSRKIDVVSPLRKKRFGGDSVEEEEKIIAKGKAEFFHVHPFGVQKLRVPRFNTRILPTYNNEGTLYIGLSDLKPPQTLSVLFQHAEGSADPDAAKQEITWSYLRANGIWSSLRKDTHILADSTNDLLTSGIIKFDLPEEMTDRHTLLPDHLFWIRASVKKDSDAICDLISVQAQAVAVSFADQGNDPDHLRTPLAAETISKLLTSDAAVDKVTQPYSSFNGQIKEQRPEFYTRISERLRHKQRAITIWDYEHLVLQKFPSVYKVKCINHTRFTTSSEEYTEMIPGHVTLIVISNVNNKNAVDPLRPKTSLATLAEIKTYMESIMPECVTLHVKNPIYEEIDVDFQVRFNEGVDVGLYRGKLEQEIKDFLSPWASDCPTEIRFGGRIHKSMILNFVEERSYVDFVTCFKMNHKVILEETTETKNNIDEAIATRAVSILGSADSHSVNIIPAGSEDCQCDDNMIENTSVIASVEDCPCEEEELPQSLTEDIPFL